MMCNSRYKRPYAHIIIGFLKKYFARCHRFIDNGEEFVSLGLASMCHCFLLILMYLLRGITFYVPVVPSSLDEFFLALAMFKSNSQVVHKCSRPNTLGVFFSTDLGITYGSWVHSSILGTV